MSVVFLVMSHNFLYEELGEWVNLNPFHHFYKGYNFYVFLYASLNAETLSK